MRISCDLDGVLADMDTALAKLAEEEFGISAKAGGGRERASLRAGPGDVLPGAPAAAVDAGAAPGDLPSAAVLFRLTSRQQARLWQRVRETRNFWDTLDEHEPGAVRRLQHLAHDLRWDVIFVTQRPPTSGRTPQVQSQRWLHRHGFQHPSVFTTQGSRGRIAAALTLDAHIDDRLENCIDIASDSKAWPILVWRDDDSFARVSAGASKLGIATVRTVNEALDKLEQADRVARSDTPQPADGNASLLDRLKRAFQR
jgi:hypothetical protein